MRVMKHRIYEQRAKHGAPVEVSLLKECFLAPGGVAPSKPVSIGKMLTTLTTKGSPMGIGFYELPHQEEFQIHGRQTVAKQKVRHLATGQRA